MHKYIQACGLTNLKTENEVHDFLKNEVIRVENTADSLRLSGGCVLTEYRCNVAGPAGIAVAVMEYPDGDREIQYYYPYLDSPEISSGEVCIVERHTSCETFAGLIDENKSGMSLIFYITDPVAYRKRPDCGTKDEFRGTWLTAFTNEAIVILPTVQMEEEAFGLGIINENRQLETAVNGEDDGPDIMTEADIDVFREINERIENEDLYSIVDQTLMPSGVECDQYSVIAHIVSVDSTVCFYSGEELWILSLSCNDVRFRLCVRKAALLGEPMEGRRIKCRIWLQGKVDFSD